MREWLAIKRKESGLTQAQLANEIGISQQGYGAIENGIRGVRVPLAKKIAAALGFEWQRFYEDERDERNGKI